MAEYLSSIFATEKDKVNCSFYFKIGACRHGDTCSRIHNRPLFSPTILLQNLYQPPADLAKNPDNKINDKAAQRHFEEFFEDTFLELEEKYGKVEEMHVCDNLSEHLIGNVYVKFESESIAEKALKDLNNRWFDKRPVYAELSPVTDFEEACCRQYRQETCSRGAFCNFMHLKRISDKLGKQLMGSRHKRHSSRSKSRSHDSKDDHRTSSKSHEDKRRHRNKSDSPSEKISDKLRHHREDPDHNEHSHSSKSHSKDNHKASRKSFEDKSRRQIKSSREKSRHLKK